GKVVAVKLCQLVGSVRGELRVAGPEIDHDPARVLDLVDAQRLVVGAEHQVLLGLSGAGSGEADQAQGSAHGPGLHKRAGELGPRGQLEVDGELQRQIVGLQGPYV